MSWFRRRRREPEVSPGGSQIYRYERAAKPTLSAGDAELIEAISAHIETHIGEPEGVYHQLVSEYVHVDIHIVPPSEERPWLTLVTSGMSERPMAAPPELGEEVKRAELTLALPPDWPIDDESFSDERHYWPFRLLQNLALLPHQFDTWLWFGHSIPNGDPAEPYAPDTPLCGTVLGPAMLPGEEFTRLDHEGHVVGFLAVYPVHEDEMNLKLEHGSDALLDRFAEVGLTELLDPQRASVIESA